MAGLIISARRKARAAQRRAREERRDNIVTAVAGIALAVAPCIPLFMMAAQMETPRAAPVALPACQLIAVDDAGREFVAGSGDTLADAQQGARLPARVAYAFYVGCN